MPSSNLARAATPTAATRAPSRQTPLHAVPSAAPTRMPVARRRTLRWPVITMGLTLAALNVVGAPYYLADRAFRVRHAWHPWLRSSGYIGQTAGIVAFLIFVFLWLYPLRKRWKALAFTGPIGKWLDVHVATAIGLPLLLTIHAAWRSEGVIGLGFDAMLVVCASGVVGRYLYARIPRTRSGVELSRDEVVRQREELVRRIATTLGLSAFEVERSLSVSEATGERISLWRAFTQLILSDWHRWRMTRRLPAAWAAMSTTGATPDPHAVREAVRLASREIALAQQGRMLDATQRVFRFWHVAHRPFAITALIAVVVHVVVVVAVGSTWFY